MTKEEFVDLIIGLNISLKDFVEGEHIALTIKFFGIPTLIKICKIKNWDTSDICEELKLFEILFLGGK